MHKLSDVNGKPIYVPKRGKKNAFERLGKAHMAVFSPEGTRVVGFLVKRPDIVGMVKLPDTFVAVDALEPVDGGYRVTMGDDAFEDRARKRLCLDWDRCIMWAGMDAKTTKGKVIGYVGDATFDLETGEVEDFLISDGTMAEQLIGMVRVPASMLVGYDSGCMIVTPEAAKQELTGGLAARAGEASARAKVEGAKAAEAAGRAVDKGSRALGRQLGKTKGMFGAFVEEYKKASQ